MGNSYQWSEGNQRTDSQTKLREKIPQERRQTSGQMIVKPCDKSGDPRGDQTGQTSHIVRE